MAKLQASLTILSVLLIGCTASIDRFESYGDFYVDIQGSARGLPLVRNVSPPIVETGYESYCCRSWVRDGWKETPQPENTHTTPPLDTTKRSNGQTVAPLWHLDNAKGELKSPPKQILANRFCVLALVRLPVNSTFTIALQPADDASKLFPVSTLRGKDFDYDWVLRHFDARTPKPLRDKPTVLVMTAEKADTENPIYIQWAGFCEPGSQEQRVLVSGKFSAENASLQARGVMADSAYTVVGGECQNGGRIRRFGRQVVCECIPGFHGALCESGCGTNKYGLECRGKCSDDGGRECAGFKACHGGGVCTCMPGWKGEKCERKCRPGWYGSGCDQKCGTCKGDDACNRHTGQCDDGCEDGFQAPLCQNVCGRPISRNSHLQDGSIADPIDFPWSAALYDTQRGGSEPHFICSATLVTRSLLITAAHCVFDRVASQTWDADRYLVVFGKQRHTLNITDIYESRTQRRKLSRIHVPPNYKDQARSYADDIAVLEMTGQVELSNLTRPACFDWTGRFQPDFGQVGNGEVVGWGIDENGKIVDKMLLAKPAYRSLNDCIKNVEQNFLPFLTPDKFCGINTGRQALRRGNSGGGLTFDSFLVGVTSVGSPTDYKTIGYTNVSYHSDWLNKVRTQVELQKTGSPTTSN